MATIPNIVHFVFGLREQTEAFHLLHYLAIESCRRHQQPRQIFFYYHHLPWGMYWDLVRPHLTLVKVEPVQDVEEAEYDDALVPAQYRYAHHADFIRLDALIEHGGIYADIDTVFVSALPPELLEHSFVIGSEGRVIDELTGEVKSSLCNALLLAEPGAQFGRAWRAKMADALNGTWSNHSCFLPQRLSEELPGSVHVEPESSFFSVPASEQGLAYLLEEREQAMLPSSAYSIHLWAHLWWQEGRDDFSTVSGAHLTLEHLRNSQSLLARLVRDILPEPDIDDIPRL